MTFAFVTYETSYAPCGGIQAVMNYLPGAIKRASGSPVVLITPFHHQIGKTNSLKLKSIGIVKVAYRSRMIKVAVLKKNGAVPTFFLKAEDESFFAGRKHPYDVPTGSGDSENLLLRDAILFGAATVKALRLIAPRQKFTLMMQDWEAATCVLPLTGKKHRHKLFVTLHNSYDSPAPGPILRQFGIAPSACRGFTILQRTLPFVSRDVFTVSDQFAVDFRRDPLQSIVMAPHLQKLLKTRLIGVCNGPFVKQTVDKQLIRSAKEGDFKPIESWKRNQKKNALRALAKVKQSENRPVWGDPRAFRKIEEPWYVFAGRDDSRQKGYDVAVAAIRSFLRKRRDAQFLFFPIPGDEGLAGLSFLKKLASSYPENVIAFPFIWREGFSASLCGAAYGVMPSLYEPFGMASEFYLTGTVGLARATGGLNQQICPLACVSSCSPAALEQSQCYHKADSAPTGFLFREALELPEISDDWRAINAARYNDHAREDRVQERNRLGLFKAMAAELTSCLTDAHYVYENDPSLYYEMLARGVDLAGRRFSWKRSAEEYLASCRAAR